MKYRVRLLYDVHGWAYHRRCQALQKYAPEDFEVTIGGRYGQALREKSYDLVLQLCYSCTGNVRNHCDKAGYRNIVVVTGINVGWKAGRGYLRPALKNGDWVVFNSKKAWVKAGRPKRTSYISNGVDREIYRPTIPIAQRKPCVLSIGSKFHRANKGFDDILRPLETQLKQHGIPSDFRCVNSHSPNRMSAEEMNAYYNTGTIYVVASRTEGTPNPALEAASAGCVLVATRVGNMPELIEHGVNGMLVERNVKAMPEAVLKCQKNYAEMASAMQAAIEPWHWKTRGEQYFDLFRRLIEEKRARLSKRSKLEQVT